MNLRAKRKKDECWALLYQPGLVIGKIIKALAKSFQAHSKDIFVLDISRLKPSEVRELIFKIRPQVIFTIDNLLNHSFQKELEEVSSELDAWYLCWFIDHPLGFQPEFIPKERSIIFIWDKAYFRLLIEKGFDKVYYLPLAGDERIRSEKKAKKFKVSFLGSLRYYNQLFEELGTSCPKILNFADELFEESRNNFSKDRFQLAQKILKKRDLKIYSNLNEHFKEVYKFAVCYFADQKLRKELVCSSPARVVVFGGKKWKVLGDRITYLGKVNYDVRGEIYCASEINLNFHQAQCRTSLNQRVFDVPLAGGFLITDYKLDLNELFDSHPPVCYENFEELRDLIRWWLNNPQKREKEVEKQREEILSRHLFYHRAQQIMNIYKEITKNG